VTRRKSDRKIVAMAYNYAQKDNISVPVANSLTAADAIDASGSARTVEIQMRGLNPNAVFDVETLDREHGDAVIAWEKMGSPEPPTREQAEQLRKEAWGDAEAGQTPRAFSPCVGPWCPGVGRLSTSARIRPGLEHFDGLSQDAGRSAEVA